jgi:hypothetical protein
MGEMEIGSTGAVFTEGRHQNRSVCASDVVWILTIFSLVVFCLHEMFGELLGRVHLRGTENCSNFALGYHGRTRGKRHDCLCRIDKKSITPMIHMTNWRQMDSD